MIPPLSYADFIARNHHPSLRGFVSHVNQHRKLQDWVAEMARTCEPDEIVWIDGSEEERERLTQEAVSRGELILLDQEQYPGCLYRRVATNDVARTEHLTFICTTNRDDTGPTNNWMSPEEGYRRAGEIFAGSMKGRTMYVIPFSMGPVGAPFSKIGIGITTSIYVVLSLGITTYIGTSALERLDTESEFTQIPSHLVYVHPRPHPLEHYEPLLGRVAKGWQERQAGFSDEWFEKMMKSMDAVLTEKAKRNLRRHDTFQKAEELAEDASQQFLLSMFGDCGFHNYDGIEPLHRRINTGLRRTCERIARYDRRQLVPAFDDNAKRSAWYDHQLRAAPAFDDKQNDPAFHVARLEVAEKVRQEIARLPGDQRDMVRWVCFEGRTIASISRERGINANTLDARLRRAYSTLRRRLRNLDW